MTEYRIVCRPTAAALEEAVNALAKEGWTCTGGVSLLGGMESGISQALMKDDTQQAQKPSVTARRKPKEAEA